MRQDRRGQEGAGLIALLWGVVAFLMFLLLATHVAVILHTRTTATGLGYEATRQAALDGGTPQAIDAADSWLQHQAGSIVVARRWSVEEDVVVLDMSIVPPRVLPASVLRWSAESSRRFAVRRETGLP